MFLFKLHFHFIYFQVCYCLKCTYIIHFIFPIIFHCGFPDDKVFLIFPFYCGCLVNFSREWSFIPRTLMMRSREAWNIHSDETLNWLNRVKGQASSWAKWATFIRSTGGGVVKRRRRRAENVVDSLRRARSLVGLIIYSDISWKEMPVLVRSPLWVLNWSAAHE